MMLSEGCIFAEKYELIKQLGRGGFSEVWLAKYTVADGLDVAIKIYAPGMGLDINGQEMFTKEFSLVFNLTHTNLLRPTHYDIWEGMPYLLLPYCKNGSTYNKYVLGNAKIPEGEAWKMLHDVAAGLAYLHEKEPPIIHQDIKPDNILIDDDGRYMITDFGISSKVRSTIRKNQSEEMSGGTFAYMAPERFSAMPKPIMASDVWALGAMMYELMMGVPPFGNHGGILQKNGAEIPIVEGDYSEELKSLVYKCLAMDAWDRPNSRALADLTYDHLHGRKTTISLKKEKLQTAPVPAKTPITEIQKMHSELWLNKDKRKWLIGSAVAVIVLLLILLSTCGGGQEEKIITQKVVIDSTLKFDSVAYVQLEKAISLKAVADQFSAEHADALLDEDNGLVENKYIDAFLPTKELLDGTYRDSISKEMFNRLVSHQREVVAELQDLQKKLIDQSAKLRKYGEAELAKKCEARANKIDRIITK